MFKTLASVFKVMKKISYKVLNYLLVYFRENFLFSTSIGLMLRKLKINLTLKIVNLNYLILLRIRNCIIKLS